MPLLTTAREKNIFTVFAKRAGTIYDTFQANLEDYILRQRALGVSREEIVRRLIADANNGQHIFRELAGDIEKELDISLFQGFQASSNPPDGSGALYHWELDDSAEHCDSCLYQASRGDLTIDQFPIPSNQETHGETNCETYCKCTLVRTEV